MSSWHLEIADWQAKRFDGTAPTRQFLIDGLFPMGCASLLAAQGDTGKGMILLDLALKVASYDLHYSAFGPEVLAHGTAVIFSAEDDQNEIHRRLNSLDPLGQRLLSEDKLIIVPLPNAGGPFPIVQQCNGKPVVSAIFEAICDQLRQITDLKLVIFDPLSSFMHIDINTDPAMGSYATGVLAKLATETGASVIVAHHMRKPTTSKQVETPEQARESIRGTSALTDGVRFVYALWPAIDAYQVAVSTHIGKPIQRNQLYQGATVKSNGPADRTVRTYFRADTGLLTDITKHVEGCDLLVGDSAASRTKRRVKK